MFPDSIPSIDYFHELGIPSAVLTNGNADLSLCKILGPKLLVSIQASEVGTVKPNVLMFMSVCQRCQVIPSRVLFIGDSYKHDIKGSLQLGMIAGLLIRNESNSIEITEPQEIYRTTLENEKYFVMSSLYPETIVPKLASFLRLHSDS